MLKKRYYDHLLHALKLHQHKDIISIVGGGGKTSTLIRLGKELSNCEKRVILSTTTHMEKLNFDLIRFSGKLTNELVEKIETSILNEPVIVAQRLVRGNRIKGLSIEQVAEINREVTFDYMIIEADGAEKKSLKAPHKYEPPVPYATTLFIVVIGFDILGKKLNIKNVHRPQNVARITGKPLESVIQPSDIISLLKHPHGLLKNRPPATRTVVILNKVTDPQINEALNLADGILKYGQGINSVICGEVNKQHQLLLFA
ncbi:MAG: selenium cofactor biosynthesis protein YqeC [Elusimicrobiota bacterium]